MKLILVFFLCVTSLCAQQPTTQQFCDGQSGAADALAPLITQFSQYVIPPNGKTAQDVATFWDMAVRFVLGEECTVLRLRDRLDQDDAEIAALQQKLQTFANAPQNAGAPIISGYWGNVPPGANWNGLTAGMSSFNVEGVNAALMPSGTFSNLCASNWTALDASGSITIALYAGNANTGKTATGLSIVIPAGASAGTQVCDLKDTFTTTGTEFVEYKITDTNTGASRYMSAVTIQFQ